MFRIIFNNIFQFYQLFASDFNLQSAIRVLQTMVPSLFIICYFSVYFGLLTVRINFFILLYLLCLLKKKKRKLLDYGKEISHFKVKLLYVRFKFDYEVLSDEEELNIMKKYTKRSKLYVYLIVGKRTKKERKKE